MAIAFKKMASNPPCTNEGGLSFGGDSLVACLLARALLRVVRPSVNVDSVTLRDVVDGEHDAPMRPLGLAVDQHDVVFVVEILVKARVLLLRRALDEGVGSLDCAREHLRGVNLAVRGLAIRCRVENRGIQ